VPDLARLVQKDADDRVRTEAVRALGKIGQGAASASDGGRLAPASGPCSRPAPGPRAANLPSPRMPSHFSSKL
jgi:hypothetical protein